MNASIPDSIVTLCKRCNCFVGFLNETSSDRLAELERRRVSTDKKPDGLINVERIQLLEEQVIQLQIDLKSERQKSQTRIDEIFQQVSVLNRKVRKLFLRDYQL